MSDKDEIAKQVANKYICELEARLNERNDSATTWDWVMQSLKRNKDHAVIVRLEPDGNLSFLHGDPTKKMESKLADYEQDCETLARYIRPSAPKFIRDIADNWRGEEDTDPDHLERR